MFFEMVFFIEVKPQEIMCIYAYNRFLELQDV